MKLLLVFLVLVAALPVTASAAPQTFVNGGLKFESVVNLDVVGDDARGAFLVSEYDRDHASRFPFTGKVVPTPKGKTGVWLEIQFDPKSLKDNATPYAIPEGAKRILWTLRIVKHRAHLFIPMSQRAYEPRPGKWIVSEVEFEPER